jgi:hypothetical protein
VSTFQGGPAAGVTLLFARAPLYLRVVQGAGRVFDVLDRLDDEPTEGEEIHVYRRVGPQRPVHINNRGSRLGPRSGWYDFADYAHVPLPEDVRAGLRDTAAWRQWAAQAARESGSSEELVPS